MAWVGDHLFSVAQWLVGGFTLNCPESTETVMNDMREIGPSYYFGPPRTFEGLLTAVSIRMEDAAAPKRWLYAKFMALARRVGADTPERRSRSASATGCCTRSATCWSTGRCATCWA